jgi:hypothetical protein
MDMNDRTLVMVMTQGIPDLASSAAQTLWLARTAYAALLTFQARRSLLRRRCRPSP